MSTEENFRKKIDQVRSITQNALKILRNQKASPALFALAAPAPEPPAPAPPAPEPPAPAPEPPAPAPEPPAPAPEPPAPAPPAPAPPAPAPPAPSPPAPAPPAPSPPAPSPPAPAPPAPAPPAPSPPAPAPPAPSPPAPGSPTEDRSRSGSFESETHDFDLNENETPAENNWTTSLDASYDEADKVLMKSKSYEAIETWVNAKIVKNSYKTYSEEEVEKQKTSGRGPIPKERLPKIGGTVIEPFNRLEKMHSSGNNLDCLIHSLLRATSPSFRTLMEEDKNVLANYFRKNIVYSVIDNYLKKPDIVESRRVDLTKISTDLRTPSKDLDSITASFISQDFLSFNIFLNDRSDIWTLTDANKDENETKKLPVIILFNPGEGHFEAIRDPVTNNYLFPYELFKAYADSRKAPETMGVCPFKGKDVLKKKSNPNELYVVIFADNTDDNTQCKYIYISKFIFKTIEQLDEMIRKTTKAYRKKYFSVTKLDTSEEKKKYKEKLRRELGSSVTEQDLNQAVRQEAIMYEQYKKELQGELKNIDDIDVLIEKGEVSNILSSFDQYERIIDGNEPAWKGENGRQKPFYIDKCQFRYFILTDEGKAALEAIGASKGGKQTRKNKKSKKGTRRR